MNITEIPIQPKTEFRIKGDEDTVYIINASQRICILRNGWVGPPIDTTMLFLQRDDFEIVPDEPKVLTADQWINKSVTSDGSLKNADQRLKTLITNCFNFAHLNGRLERDLEMSEIISLSWSVAEAVKDGNKPVFWPELLLLLRNLKPLNPK